MNRLLIIVDMQEGFRNDNVLSIVANIRNLVMSFNGDIIFSCFENEKGSIFEDFLDYKSFQQDYEREILSELSDFTFRKFEHNTYSIFTEKLFNFIEKKEYDEIVLCGVYTDVSIHYAAMDLFDLGVKTRIISDCVMSQNEDANFVFLESLRRIIGKDNVLNTDEVLCLE